MVLDATRFGLDAFCAARRDDDLDALGRQPFGNGQADPDAAAGDHRDLLGQSKVHVVLPVRL